MTRERAREILRRVWVDGVSITAEQWAELDGLPGETAFERCMGAAGIPGWESVMALAWPERTREVEWRLKRAEVKP